MNKIKIIGIDCQLGSREILLLDLSSKFEATQEDIIKKTGITKLYAWSHDESLLSVGKNVVERLLQNKQVALTQINGIFGSTNSSDSVIPTFTVQLASALGLENIIADHIGIGCSGGLQALRNAYNQLLVDDIHGKISYYLVVAGDCTNSILDPESFGTGIMFSEGFGAMLITNDSSRCNGYEIQSIASKSLLTGSVGAISLKSRFFSPESFVKMDGKALFRFGTTGLLDHIFALLDLSVDQFKASNMYLIPHQPNLRMLEKLMENYELVHEKIYTDGIKTIGNTSGPATFFGLKDALSRSLYNLSDEIIIGTFGAELQVAAAHLIPIGDVRKII